MAVPIATRKVGSTEISVSEFGFGTAPLGDLFTTLTEDEAQTILQTAWDNGVRYYDTAPFYGYTKSEHRLGWFLRQQKRNEFVVSTKIGRIFQAIPSTENFKPEFWSAPMPFDLHFDYSYDGIMRSYEDSLQRLGLNSIDLLLIHDLDYFFHPNEERVTASMAQVYTSGWRALDELRSSGQIKAVGAGLNMLGMVPRFLEMVDLDFFIIAMPYTLLDQDALDVEFAQCAERNVNIVIGSVFASGILATGATENALYAYEPAPAEVLEKTRRMEAVCQRHHVPLPAAALQFPLAHPIVSAVIPGAHKPAHIHSNIKCFHYPIPNDLWAELKTEGLLREDAPTPVC